MRKIVARFKTEAVAAPTFDFTSKQLKEKLIGIMRSVATGKKSSKIAASEISKLKAAHAKADLLYNFDNVVSSAATLIMKDEKVKKMLDIAKFLQLNKQGSDASIMKHLKEVKPRPSHIPTKTKK